MVATRVSTSCRACGSANVSTVLSLGEQPPANAFLSKAALTQAEERYPLDVQFCSDCTLLQLKDAVPGEVLFRNYVYNSSTSPVFVKHFEGFANDVIRRFDLAPDALIVDIGSNDGILLRPFRSRGRSVLGVDPAEAIARMATASGIETWPRFFGTDVADEIVRPKGRADLVTATNSFAHIDALDDVTRGVERLLKPEGVLIIEVAWVLEFLKQGLFDTVYHEHLYYWGVRSLQQYLQRFGLEVFDVQRVETHGGSIRLYAQRVGGPRSVQPSVGAFIEQERRAGVHSARSFQDMARRVEMNRRALKAMLVDLKARGRRIAGYGAPAKGNTLLNHFGIGRDLLDYIVDDAPLKQGLYTPGTHVPVVAADELKRSPPDYLLILAWNFADPIMRKLSGFADAGGTFIVPVPEPHIVQKVAP